MPVSLAIRGARPRVTTGLAFYLCVIGNMSRSVFFQLVVQQAIRATRIKFNDAKSICAYLVNSYFLTCALNANPVTNA